MELGGKYPNLYTDISINSRTLRINQAVNKYGFRNLVFGSDIPYDSQGVALLKIKEAGLSKEDEDLILGGNAAKIFGLDSDVVKEGERIEGDGK
jgi:predicted TIM-barrel fold metal-dependent hydrolase